MQRKGRMGMMRRKCEIEGDVLNVGVEGFCHN